MKFIKTLILFLLVGFASNCFACDCNSQGEFLTVAPKSEFVALVKVTRFLTFKDINDERIPMSMEVEVISIYKGKESRKSVTVWGDDGILCRPYLSRFSKGKFYVIAFSEGSDGALGRGHQQEKTTDYSISICGDYWLTADVGKNVAVGPVSKNKGQISLTALEAKLSQ